MVSVVVSVVCVVVSVVVVVVCVCACAVYTLKNPCVHSTRSSVYVQNVSVYAGTTPACVSTCARGAVTHGDVLNVHTVTFRVDTRRREEIIVSSAYQNLPTNGHHVLQRVHQRNPWILHI